MTTARGNLWHIVVRQNDVSALADGVSHSQRFVSGRRPCVLPLNHAREISLSLRPSTREAASPPLRTPNRAEPFRLHRKTLSWQFND